MGQAAQLAEAELVDVEDVFEDEANQRTRRGGSETWRPPCHSR